MPVSVMTETAYYLTEVNIKLPTDVGEVERILKQIKATGKIVAVYNAGGVVGINVEQRTKIPEAVKAQIRELLGIGVKNM